MVWAKVGFYKDSVKFEKLLEYLKITSHNNFPMLDAVRQSEQLIHALLSSPAAWSLQSCCRRWPWWTTPFLGHSGNSAAAACC